MRIGIYGYITQEHWTAGSGHGVRLQALAAGLADHELLWLGQQPADTAGHQVDVPLTGSFVGSTLAARGKELAARMDDWALDALITEYLPFGRSVYLPELLPVLDAARSRRVPVISSVRDLIGKEPWEHTYVTGSLEMANHYYDHLLWHGDSALLPFDYPAKHLLTMPVVSTGYLHLGQPVPPQPAEHHLVVTVGGASHPEKPLPLLLAVLGNVRRWIDAGWRITLQCGARHEPFVRPIAEGLAAESELRVVTWAPDLPALLATATVSVSLCGYNTALNVMQSQRPGVFVALVEFGNVEQWRRAEALARYPGYRALRADSDTLTTDLGRAVAELADSPVSPPPVRLDGVAEVARFFAAGRPPVRAIQA